MKYLAKRFLGKVYSWLLTGYLSGNFQQLIREGIVKVGRHSYGVPQVHSWPDGAKLVIGNFTSIADEVHVLLGGDHPIHWISTFPHRIKLGLDGAYSDGMPSSKGDVIIGSDVWIGHGATILSGVQIGDGAIIVAKSVVVKDVEPYAIVGGIPAKVLRKRYSDEEIACLRRIRWWDWTDEKIKEAVPLLSSGNLKSFLDTYCVPEIDGRT